MAEMPSAAQERSSLHASMQWGSKCMDDEYDKDECIGEGTYGEVFRAKSKSNPQEIVALKRVRMSNEKEGFPITAIREIKLLKQLKHKNIINLKEIVTDKDKSGIYMVFEYMDHDLSGLLEAGHVFNVPTIKCYMKQLLQGLEFCHKNKVLHRDIKASNVLIDNKGCLKLADFGLARMARENAEKYTNHVITRWYRPPELLLGSTKYGPEVDVWGVGCIFYELLERRPLFPGKTEIEQLDLIFRLCGTATKHNWPSFVELPHHERVHTEEDGSGKVYPRTLLKKYPHLEKHALDLLDKFLTLDPAKRITAHDALSHPYFWNQPLPAMPHEIPPYEQSCHDRNTKKRRREQQRQQQAKQAPQDGGPAGSHEGHAAKRPALVPTHPPAHHPHGHHHQAHHVVPNSSGNHHHHHP